MKEIFIVPFVMATSDRGVVADLSRFPHLHPIPPENISRNYCVHTSSAFQLAPLCYSS
jgi:hypothetical protein